ncbi:replication-relaxation family protein [Candidatus Saccharibacteria bacterium]|nr:replication-relaxation family protein [Candidatus Saccharibacteria bacterium]
MSELVTKSSNVDTVKYRRPLNKQQLKTLQLLYWYRFCTSKQLARSLDKPSHKAIQNKLQILEAQGFIGKRYDKSYKLAGRAAEYFITPKGARALEKAKPNTTNQWATKSLYKNKTVSDDFLRHCITVTEISQRLRDIYGDGSKLRRFSKSYMAEFSYYPTWTPDLHLEILSKDETSTKHYFLDVWDGTKPFFVGVRKTRNYVNFKDSGNKDGNEWQEDEPFPAILAICEDERSQKKLNRQMKRILDEQWDDELIFATTTTNKLQQATKPADKIWSRILTEDSPETASLKGLLVY